MSKKLVLVGAALGALLVSTAAEARSYYYDSHHRKVYYRQTTVKNCRQSANKGTAIGGIGGALAGQAIGHNTGGTVIGAGVGAVAGHQIAKNNCRHSHR